MRSSPQARRLIRAYIARYGTEREAAKMLHITQAALNGMKRGRLHDTPQMKIEIECADRRAARAWSKNDQESHRSIDAVATLRAAQRALGQAQSMIDEILKGAA